MKKPMAWDMFNRELQINDRVQIVVDGILVEGIVNYIGINDYIKVNSLVGEFRRKGKNVIKILS